MYSQLNVQRKLLSKVGYKNNRELLLNISENVKFTLRAYIFVTKLPTDKKVKDDSLQKKRKRLDTSVSQSSIESSKKKTQDGGPEVERNGTGELVFTGIVGGGERKT